MPHIAAGVDFADQMASPGRRVALGPECHRDLEVWRWDVDESFDAIGGTLSAPMYHLLERPAQRTLLSDASKPAVGGGGESRNCCVLALRSFRPETGSVLRIEEACNMRG